MKETTKRDYAFLAAQWQYKAEKLEVECERLRGEVERLEKELEFDPRKEAWSELTYE